MRILVLIALIGLVYSVTEDCGDQSVLNNQGVCIKPYYMQGCYQYASTLQCAICSYNYALDKNGKCQYSPVVSKSCCKSRNPVSGNCEVCQNGLFLQNNKCNQIRLIGCLSQDQKGACVKCAKRYYLENGQCRAGVQNCAQYLALADTKICDQCVPGHSLVNNACLPNTILGCRDQVDGVCKDCYDPFFQKNNHCQVPNCQSHNQFGCVTCQCGYFLTTDRKCNQISQGCIRYNRGVCTDCMQHFSLKGGVCDIEGCIKIDGIRCTQCIEGYESTELGCKLKNCLISKQGLCQVCAQGYHHKQGLCIQSSVIQIV